MTVRIETGYLPATQENGRSLLANNPAGDRLLINTSGDRLLLYGYDNADPWNRAHILHSQIWLTPSTVTATSTATGYYASAIENTLTYEKWKPSTMPGTLTIAHTTAGTMTACCIAAHTLGTSSATATIERKESGVWVSVGTVSPTDDSPIMVLFPACDGQNVRITVSGLTPPEIGVVCFGEPLIMERNIYGGHSPFSLSRQTELRANYSETGEFLGRTKQRQTRPVNFSWSNLSATFVHANWAALQKGIEAEPFFVAWRPYDYGDVAFGQTDQVPVPSNMGIRDLMQVGLQVRGRGYD